MKIFRNRITQENENKIKKMKSLWIDNMDKEVVKGTPYGLFALSLNPNQYVDEVDLERTFKSILHSISPAYAPTAYILRNFQSDNRTVSRTSNKKHRIFMKCGVFSNLITRMPIVSNCCDNIIRRNKNLRLIEPCDFVVAVKRVTLGFRIAVMSHDLEIEQIFFLYICFTHIRRKFVYFSVDFLENIGLLEN